MPLPRYYGCICRKAVERLSWPDAYEWNMLSREQQGELTKGQVRKMQASLNHKPVYTEHPEDGYKVKVGEVVHNYLTEDDAWYVVLEINDGHPAGVDLLKRIKANELKGLSLSHDTSTLEADEVSVVKEGFRLGTGIEGEMDSVVSDFAQIKMQEYKETDAYPYSSTIPKHINASLFANMNQNGATSNPAPPQVSNTYQPPPSSQNPQYNGTPTTNNNNNNHQHHQQPQQPSSTTTQTQPPPQNGAQTPASGDHSAIDKLMASNISSTEKTALLSYINGLNQDKRKLEAKVEIQSKNDKDSMKYYIHLLNTLISQAGGDATSNNDEEQLSALALENPAQYAQAMIPKVIKASARFNARVGDNNNGNFTAESSEYNPNHVTSPIEDVNLNAQYQMFLQLANNNVGVGNYSMPSSSSSSYHNQQQQQPRFMQASNNRRPNEDYSAKRARNTYESAPYYGAGSWLSDPNLNISPETRAIMYETQSAAISGFGDSVRLSQLQPSNKARQFVPDESQLVPAPAPRY